jgi:hypothetical protein
MKCYKRKPKERRKTHICERVISQGRVRYSGMKRRKSVATRRSQKRQEKVKFIEFKEG